MFAKWARDFQRHSNQLPLFDQKLSDSVGGDPNIRYYHSHWALAEDEALVGRTASGVGNGSSVTFNLINFTPSPSFAQVINASPPPCRTWNFQVNNYWMESLDYRYHRIHVNKVGVCALV